MKPLVIVTGPTASGKSSLCVKLAKEINGEIISADSVQVYKRLDIGSAKITSNEMQGIKHYLIDCLEPTEEFNIALFKELAESAIDEILGKKKIPIICGGTGFYIQSLLHDVDFEKTPDKDDNIRRTLEQYALENGNHALHELLKEIDEESYNTIHENNVKRVIRAIEFYKVSGMKISEHNSLEKEKESLYNFAYFVLNDERETIYNKIDKRVDIMLDNGLINEVEELKKEGLSKNNISMQALGYKEILDYINGDITLDEAIYIIKRDTRHFAKRQLTWFRREKDAMFINKNEFENDNKILEYIKEKLLVKKII